MTKAAKEKKSATNKVTITLHGQKYIVACGAGEEKKLEDLVALVNAKIEEVAAANANATELRLFAMTCLLLADEMIETRHAATQNRKEDEGLMIAAVDHLRERILSILEMVEKTRIS